MEDEKTNKWKIIAIVFIILFFCLVAFIIYGLYLNSQDEKKTYECWYNLCGEYADAEFSENICYCYEYDTLGQLIVAKTQYMG
jgi:hypothetical protein